METLVLGIALPIVRQATGMGLFVYVCPRAQLTLCLIMADTV